MPSPTVGPPPPEGQLSIEEVRNLLFATNQQVQAIFREKHPDVIEHAVRGIKEAHDNLDLFRARAPATEKSATLELFFHAAINAVVCATHHLLSGYPVSAGNMLRHHIEAVAMAMLCIDESSGVFERFSADRQHYPVHDAPQMLKQRKRREALTTLIAFDPDAWDTTLELKELYDRLSHASALSLAYSLRLDSDNVMLLGGEYDPAKADAYGYDLRRCATAAESCSQLISVITATLYPEPPQKNAT